MKKLVKQSSEESISKENKVKGWKKLALVNFYAGRANILLWVSFRV